MKVIRYALAAASLWVPTNPAIASNRAGCSIANIERQSELHNFLSKRAVQIVQLATKGEQDRLEALIESSATVSLGRSDVGRHLGVGVQGAKALAAEMRADNYRYRGWNYMDGAAEPCSSQTVTVEFVNSRDKIVSQVKFTFDGGRLSDASGWSWTYESGALNAAQASH